VVRLAQRLKIRIIEAKVWPFGNVNDVIDLGGRRRTASSSAHAAQRLGQ
jgi:hypothetical protein